MNKDKILKALVQAEKDPSESAIYIQYLGELEVQIDKKSGKKKNWWLAKVTDTQLVNAFIKVAIDGLFIDGETITLAYRGGKLKITYDYHAYKNKLLMSYPESVTDFSVVYKEDAFEFSKESGKVLYSHRIGDPFNTSKTIVGAYGVIKNSRGEFLEILTLEDVKKMRAIAQTDNVWKAWFDRMVLKSVIKRSCSTHFHDKFKNIEKLDNENYDLENVDQIDKLDVFKEIEVFKDPQKLIEWAGHKDRAAYHNDEAYRKAVQIKVNSLTPKTLENGKGES